MTITDVAAKVTTMVPAVRNRILILDELDHA